MICAGEKHIVAHRDDLAKHAGAAACKYELIRLPTSKNSLLHSAACVRMKLYLALN